MTENFKNSNKKIESKEILKRKAMLRWGTPGHDIEWVINLEGFDHNNYIPDYGPKNPRGIGVKLSAILGEGFDVSNRGSRIEIFTPDSQPNYNKVVPAVKQVLEDDWEGMDWHIEVEDEETVNTQHEQAEAFFCQKTTRGKGKVR